MYLTDFRENTLQDVITKIETDLFRTVTGLRGPFARRGVRADQRETPIDPAADGQVRLQHGDAPGQQSAS